ncbi:MAG: UDP-N-acetylmuramate--L-alanine ligase [Thermodesulfobacteriota bacterium]
MYGKIKRIHFVGIGGIGMSGIAEVLINMGYEISGSDIGQSSTVKRLKDLGANITIGHRAENVKGSGVVVTSSAIRPDNPEVLGAKELNIPVIPRAEMLAELMRLRYGIAVAGSHGKTTTTSMVAAVLSYGKLDPTIVVGGKVTAMGTNARLGRGDFMVVEADESDGSFLRLSPVISVLTNIDEEHMDHYKDMDELESAFSTFINKIPFYGLSVLCLDCPRTKKLSKDFRKRFLTYGFDKEAELRAQNVTISGFETKFDVFLNDEELGSVTLNVPGYHNAQNALAAIAVGMELGMSFENTSKGLSEFRGIDRRLQIKGEGRGIRVIDDYAHHPREIEVTLSAVKESHSGRVVVIFQPHRYSRTKLLFDEFARVLVDTDMLYIMDIYAASEDPISGVSSESLSKAVIEKGGKNVRHLNGDDMVSTVLGELKENDVVITLGAGNVWAFGEKIVEELR